MLNINIPTNMQQLEFNGSSVDIKKFWRRFSDWDMTNDMWSGTLNSQSDLFVSK